MLKPVTIPGNDIHLQPKDLTVENLPTFAGTTLPSVADIVQRNALDVLSGEKIIVGDGTNKIKDSNIDATGDNINLPLDKGLWINSQPIVYQDNADSSKYKAEVHQLRANEKVLANVITSIGANDDITIDANGTGIMKFNTIINNGCLFGGATSGLGFNWAIKTTFDTAGPTDACVIAGTSTIGADKVATIGSNDLQASAWTPLFMQPSPAPGAYLVIGDETLATAAATGAKLYTKGLTYTTGQSICESSMVVRRNGANGHTITSGTAPSANYNHFLQSKTETLAGVDDTKVKSWSTDTGTGVSGVSGPNFVTIFVYDATNFGSAYL